MELINVMDKIHILTHIHTEEWIEHLSMLLKSSILHAF